MGFYLNKVYCWIIIIIPGLTETMGLFVKLGFVLVLGYLSFPGASSYNAHYQLTAKQLIFLEGQIFGTCKHTCETGALKRTLDPAVHRALYMYGCSVIGNCKYHQTGWVDAYDYVAKKRPFCDYCSCDCV